MSNYLSSPFEILQPQSSINQPLIEKVLAVREGKYDANKAKIDQTLALYKEQLKGRRDVDNQYISARLTEAKNAVDSFGNKDFSLNTTTETLLNNLHSVTEDPIIQSAVLNKRKVDQYNLKVDELKKKDNKSYNDVNYAYGLYKGGVDAYDKGEIKDVGDLNYIPYTDLTEEHLKKLKTITDVKGKRFIETISPDGKYKVKKEIDGLTQDEIQNYMGSLMTSQELTQMKINGWAKYGQNEEETRKTYNSYNTKRLEANTENIKLYEARVENKNLTPEQIKEAKQQIEVLKNDKTNIENTISLKDKMPIDEIGLQLEKGNYLNGLAQLASTEWSTSTETNDVYYKDKELEIKYEELQLKRDEEKRKTLEFNAKNGVDATGQLLPNEVVTVSPAEVDTKALEGQIGQENLQSRHNTYYNQIIEVGKYMLQDPNVEPSDKKAFEQELRARGLNKDLTWIDASKGKNASIASTIKSAFDSAKLGSTYKTQAQTLSSAIIKKQNIAKDIIGVESESYNTVFNKDPEKYIDFLNVANSQISIQSQSENIWLDTENTSALKLRDDINAFSKKAGGWSNMKNYLSKNPNEIRTFASLTDRADKEYKGLASYSFLDHNLLEDAKTETEKVLQDKTKTNTLSSFTDYNTINFVNEDVNDKIIKSIPQDRITGELFEAKLPITAKLVGNDIKIVQYKGGTQKDGVFLSGAKNSEALLSPGDASYNTMLQYIEAKEGDNLGLNADTTSIKLPTYTPTIIKSTEKVKADNTAYNILQAVQSNPNISNLFLAVGGNPTAYTSEESINKTFDVKLANYPKETVDAFTSSYLNRVKNFSVTPFVAKIFGDKKWGISIKNDQNEEILNTSLGVKNLDKDTQWLLENAPQTFISEFILRELMSDTKQTKINTILDGGN